MNIQELLSDEHPVQQGQITGIYQCISDTSLTDILEKVLANKDMFPILRKNGLVIYSQIRREDISMSTAVLVGMLVSGSHIGMHPSGAYLITFEVSRDFQREHQGYTPPINIVEMLRDLKPFKWGPSIEEASAAYARHARGFYQLRDNMDYARFEQ